LILYLDTSVVLRVLLRQPDELEDWGRWEELYSSEIVKVEARRVLDRLRLESLYDDEMVARAHEALVRIERSIGLIEVTRQILERAAGPMPTVVKSLDAIHLASAGQLAERQSKRPTFATHDRQQSLAARALGFACVG